MELTLSIDGAEVADRTVYDVKVKVGRDDIESQPDAAVLNFTMLGHGAEKVGQIARLADEFGPLFTGPITDLKAQQDDTMRWEVQVTAVGSLAVLGQLYVGMGGYPEQTDSQRIYAILEESGVPHAVAPLTSGPILLEHPVGELVNAAEAARRAADDGMGILWGTPNDAQMRIAYIPASMRSWKPYPITWRDMRKVDWSYFRGNTWAQLTSDNIASDTPYPGHVTIDPATTNAEVTFEQAIGDWARKVAVTYGTDTGGGAGAERPVVIAGDQYPEVSYDTQLAEVSDATTYANTMLRRRRNPGWRLTEIQIHAGLLTDDQWWELRRELVLSLRITVPFPHGSPVGTSWDGYLEGWTHEATEEGHDLILSVSDRQMSEPADIWADISPTATWNDIPADLRWVYAVDLP